MIKDSLNKKPLVNSPTLLDDATATRLGLKEYFHGTTYNGGNAPTIGGSGITPVYGIFIPYQLQDGTWRMKFNFNTSIGASTDFTVTVNGISGTLIGQQAFSVRGSSISCIGVGFLDTNTNNFRISFNAASTLGMASGDVALSGKPTWAY